MSFLYYDVCKHLIVSQENPYLSYCELKGKSLKEARKEFEDEREMDYICGRECLTMASNIFCFAKDCCFKVKEDNGGIERETE